MIESRPEHVVRTRTTPTKPRKTCLRWVAVLIAVATFFGGIGGTLGIQSVHQALFAESALSAEQLEIEAEKAELERRGFAAPVLQDKMTDGSRVYSVKLSEGCFALITMRGGNSGPSFGNTEDANRDKVQRIQCTSNAGSQPAGR